MKFTQFVQNSVEADIKETMNNAHKNWKFFSANFDFIFFVH